MCAFIYVYTYVIMYTCSRPCYGVFDLDTCVSVEGFASASALAIPLYFSIRGSMAKCKCLYI